MLVMAGVGRRGCLILRTEMSKCEKGHRSVPFSQFLPPRFPSPSRTAHPRRSAEPLPRTISLLSRGVDYPLLRVRVHHLRSDPVEPLRGHLRVAHSSPQLAYELGQHRPLIPRYAIEALHRVFDLPRRLPTAEP